MIVHAWNNGSYHPNGSGYGIKINPKDRDKFFIRGWKTILLEFEGEAFQTELNIDKNSFWNSTCHELIGIEIGRWLIKHNLAPWPKGNPPLLNLQQFEGRRFRLSFLYDK